MDLKKMKIGASKIVKAKTAVTDAKQLKQGNRVEVINNKVFKAMGYGRMSGKVFLVYPDGHGFSMQSNQTKRMETVDFGDGKVFKL